MVADFIFTLNKDKCFMLNIVFLQVDLCENGCFLQLKMKQNSSQYSLLETEFVLSYHYSKVIYFT